MALLTLTALLFTSSLTAARSLGSASPYFDSKLSTRASQGHCVTEAHRPDWYNRNLNTVRHIYDLTVYPNNIPILLGGGAAVPKGLFSPDATGRVSPVGDFENFEDSIEYFFALAPTPFTNNQSTAFYDAQVVNFVSGCPEVAASLVYFRSGSVDMQGKLDESKPVSTLSQVAFWHFDAEGEVNKYQAWVPNLQAWTRESSGIDYSNMQVQAAAAQGLCPVIQQRCTGKDQQYASVQDCAQQLGAKPFGNFDEAWGDNIACRTIHIILTMVRPDVHCPHVGPTGGGKCVDIDYSTDYFDDARLWNQPEGSVFTCSGPLQPDNQVGAGPGAAQILQGLAQAAASGQLPGMPGMPGAGGAAAQMNPQALAGMMGGQMPAGGQQQGASGTAMNPAAQAAANAMRPQGAQQMAGTPGAAQNPEAAAAMSGQRSGAGMTPSAGGNGNMPQGAQPAMAPAGVRPAMAGAGAFNGPYMQQSQSQSNPHGMQQSQQQGGPNIQGGMKMPSGPVRGGVPYGKPLTSEQGGAPQGARPQAEGQTAGMPGQEGVGEGPREDEVSPQEGEDGSETSPEKHGGGAGGEPCGNKPAPGPYKAPGYDKVRV